MHASETLLPQAGDSRDIACTQAGRHGTTNLKARNVICIFLALGRSTMRITSGLQAAVTIMEITGGLKILQGMRIVERS
jgi:hypothetical protein